MATDMPTPREPSKAVGVRHPFGPRAIGALLPSVTRAAFRAGFRSTAGLIGDWPSIVGSQLAEMATPSRLAAGTLTLSCTGPVALELQHMAQPLIERINRHLGNAVVRRLRFIQTVQSRITVEGRPGAARAYRQPVPIANMQDGPLRDALGSLGASIASDRA